MNGSKAIIVINLLYTKTKPLERDRTEYPYVYILDVYNEGKQ